MNIDHYRVLIQNTLRAQRQVTDVSFTPLGHGVERVSFYEGNARSHFAVCLDEYEDNPDLLVAHVNGLAGTALEAAKDRVARETTKASEEAAAQVKVTA